MRAENYKYFSDFLLGTSGLMLGEGKEYLLTARLGPIAKNLGVADIDALIDKLKTSPRGPLADEMVEAMTTNETSFFRDGRPFELLFNNILPKLMKAKADSKKLRIWTAAAATGQEAYSILLGIKERVPQLASWKIEIFGTDISEQALNTAKEAVYNHFEVQRGLPATYLIKYFDRDEKRFRLKEDLKQNVRFQKANLKDSLSSFGKFDIIFVRNVLIYFDAPTKKDILERMTNSLKDDGYLFLGGSETTLGVTDKLKGNSTKHGTVYTKAQASPEVCQLELA